MPGQINLTDTDPQLIGDFLGRPFLTHVTIESLKLFGSTFLLFARAIAASNKFSFHSFSQNFIKISDPRIRHALDGRGHSVVAFRAGVFFAGSRAVAKLIDDSPACDLQNQPLKERSPGSYFNLSIF